MICSQCPGRTKGTLLIIAGSIDLSTSEIHSEQIPTIPHGLIPDLSALPAPYGKDDLSRFLVQKHLAARLDALTDPGGAWHSCAWDCECETRTTYEGSPSGAVLLNVARFLIASVDYQGVAFPSEAKIAIRTCLKEPSVRRALAVIAGEPGATPGVLFSRRRLRSGEAYERMERGERKRYAYPNFYYFADLSGAPRAASKSAGLHLAAGAATGKKSHRTIVCACGKCVDCTMRKFGRGAA